MRRAAVARFARRVALPDAVDVSRRGEDHPRMFGACCVERVYGAQHAHAERLHRERLVVAHARRRREVVYLVAADTEPVDDIVVYIPEQGVLQYAPQQGRVDRIADIDAENLVPFLQKAQAEVRADKSHPAENDYSFLHLLLLFTGVRAKSIPQKAPVAVGLRCLSSRPRSPWGVWRPCPDTPIRRCV